MLNVPTCKFCNGSLNLFCLGNVLSNLLSSHLKEVLNFGHILYVLT